MVTLVKVLEAIRGDIELGTISELNKKQQPLSYGKMQALDVREEFAGLTDAVIASISGDCFSHLKVYLSQQCKLRLEQGVRLSEIMEVFDLYEKVLKDAMSAFLKNDLIHLNIYRRETDTLLDRARVFVSEYFFQLYEDTVFKQFEHLRMINQISVHLTSSLHLDEVLKYIITDAMQLFNADCGSIYLMGEIGLFGPAVSHGWNDAGLSEFIAHKAVHMPEICIFSPHKPDDQYLMDLFAAEGLCGLLAVKFIIQDRTLGILVLGLKDKAKFSSVNKGVLVTFANYCAIAVNNAQMYGKTDQQLQERIHEGRVLLEQTRAILGSMREGLIAIDADGLITLVNSEALRFLNGSWDLVGKHILEADPISRLPLVVATGKAEYDQEHVFGQKSTIINRIPIVVNGSVVGAIATFRDKQDVKNLAEELVGVKALLDSMRAQSHEFMNKLHAISGLIQMQQYDKVVEFITQIYSTRQELVSFIVKRVKDTAIAGMLLGKISSAKEKGISLRIAPRSRVAGLPNTISNISIITILGNLVSNAIDAVMDMPLDRRFVDVYIFQGKKRLTIIVSDMGNGISNSIIDKIFQHGFSTKAGNRGIGLALVQQEIRLCSGKINISTKENVGSRFAIKIPLP